MHVEVWPSGFRVTGADRQTDRHRLLIAILRVIAKHALHGRYLLFSERAVTAASPFFANYARNFVYYCCRVRWSTDFDANNRRRSRQIEAVDVDTYSHDCSAGSRLYSNVKTTNTFRKCAISIPRRIVHSPPYSLYNQICKFKYKDRN